GVEGPHDTAVVATLEEEAAGRRHDRVLVGGGPAMPPGEIIAFDIDGAEEAARELRAGFDALAVVCGVVVGIGPRNRGGTGAADERVAFARGVLTLDDDLRAAAHGIR